MRETIKLVFTWSGLNKQVDKLVKTCHQCQMGKKAGKKSMDYYHPRQQKLQDGIESMLISGVRSRSSM